MVEGAGCSCPKRSQMRARVGARGRSSKIVVPMPMLTASAMDVARLLLLLLADGASSRVQQRCDGSGDDARNHPLRACSSNTGPGQREQRRRSLLHHRAQRRLCSQSGRGCSLLSTARQLRLGQWQGWSVPREVRYTASRSRDLDRRDQRLARGPGATAGVERGVPVLDDEQLTAQSQRVTAAGY